MLGIGTASRPFVFAFRVSVFFGARYSDKYQADEQTTVDRVDWLKKKVG